MVVLNRHPCEKMQEEIAFLKRLAIAEEESRLGYMLDIDDLDKELDNI